MEQQAIPVPAVTGVTDGYTQLTVEPDLGGRVHVTMYREGEAVGGMGLTATQTAMFAEALLIYSAVTQ